MATQRTLPDYQGFVSSQDPRTYPTQDIRNLEAQGGSQQAIVDQGQDQAFDFQAMIQKLKQAQAFGYSQEQAAQQQQFQRGTATLPSDLANKQLSGSQILGFRRGEVSAIQPTIGGARSYVAELQKSIDDFKDLETQQIGKAKIAFDIAGQGGSQALEGLALDNPSVFKLLGINPKSYIAGIKAQETETKRQFNIIHTPSGGTGGGSGLSISPIAQAVLDGVIRLEDLTPTVRGQVAPQLAAAGFKTGPKLSSGQQDRSEERRVVKECRSRWSPYH